ncbi:uncharacterized protein AAEQ78_009406 [Lycaon pictus]
MAYTILKVHRRQVGAAGLPERSSGQGPPRPAHCPRRSWAQRDPSRWPGGTGGPRAGPSGSDSRPPPRAPPEAAPGRAPGVPPGLSGPALGPGGRGGAQTPSGLHDPALEDAVRPAPPQWDLRSSPRGPWAWSKCPWRPGLSSLLRPLRHHPGWRSRPPRAQPPSLSRPDPLPARPSSNFPPVLELPPRPPSATRRCRQAAPGHGGLQDKKQGPLPFGTCLGHPRGPATDQALEHPRDSHHGVPPAPEGRRCRAQDTLPAPRPLQLVPLAGLSPLHRGPAQAWDPLPSASTGQLDARGPRGQSVAVRAGARKLWPAFTVPCLVSLSLPEGGTPRTGHQPLTQRDLGWPGPGLCGGRGDSSPPPGPSRRLMGSSAPEPCPGLYYGLTLPHIHEPRRVKLTKGLCLEKAFPGAISFKLYEGYAIVRNLSSKVVLTVVVEIKWYLSFQELCLGALETLLLHLFPATNRPSSCYQSRGSALLQEMGLVLWASEDLPSEESRACRKEAWGGGLRLQPASKGQGALQAAASQPCPAPPLEAGSPEPVRMPRSVVRGREPGWSGTETAGAECDWPDLEKRDFWSLDVKNSKWKIGQSEQEDQGINDSDVDCGHVSREVTSCTDGGGTAQPTGYASGTGVRRV